MPIQSRLGKKMELEIQRLGVNGEGVGQWYGYTIFVDGALPGERILAKLIEKRKSYGRAIILERLSSSPHRVEPKCPLFGKCGGCQLMHLFYEEQLAFKRQRVIDALERIGKFKEIDCNPCIASPTPFAYRNKIQLPVVNNRIGLYVRNTHDIIEMEQCYIHCPLGEKVYNKIQNIVKVLDLRHVLIKTAVFTNEVLVVLVTKEGSDLKGAALAIMQTCLEIKGVVQNIHREEENVVLGDEFITLAGEGYITERLCGLQFKVSPASFFQVNPPQAENLYRTVLEFAQVADKIVLDAYCGVGTLSLLAAQKAKKVIGIECVKEAIEDANINAKLNGIANVEFICGEAERFKMDVDVAILNPPRKGCERLLLENLTAKTIVYVSCDPATLARDLVILAERGYKIDSVQPFDMFPQTAHVETVIRMLIS